MSEKPTELSLQPAPHRVEAAVRCPSASICVGSACDRVSHETVGKPDLIDAARLHGAAHRHRSEGTSLLPAFGEQDRVPIFPGFADVGDLQHDDNDVRFLGRPELAQIFEAVLFPDGLHLVKGGLELGEISDELLDDHVVRHEICYLPHPQMQAARGAVASRSRIYKLWTRFCSQKRARRVRRSRHAIRSPTSLRHWNFSMRRFATPPVYGLFQQSPRQCRDEERDDPEHD